MAFDSVLASYISTIKSVTIHNYGASSAQVHTYAGARTCHRVLFWVGARRVELQNQSACQSGARGNWQQHYACLPSGIAGMQATLNALAMVAAAALQ